MHSQIPNFSTAKVVGMTELNRKKFILEVETPCIFCPKGQQHLLSGLMKCINKFLLKLPNLNPVLGDSNTLPKDMAKQILLNPNCYEEAIDTLTKHEMDTLFKVQKCLTTLTYENWSYDDILRAVIPSNLEAIGGFSVIGHIVHLNLKPCLFPYKFVIGEVLLDKLKNIKTVVNKITSIDNKFRNFEMEILAGTNDTLVSVKEGKCTFAFDFRHVYWNPRLSTEHAALVKLIPEQACVFDIFAGVGPFTIPLARKKCKVFANDLNPHSFHWLCHNIKLNKVEASIVSSMLDGKDFIKSVMKEKIAELFFKEHNQTEIHAIMNLPANAVDFLPTFKDLFSFDESNFSIPETNIFVHLYCFIKSKDGVNEFISEAEQKFSMSLMDIVISYHYVRSVAPNKEMYRLTLKFPISSLFETNIKAKRLKLDQK